MRLNVVFQCVVLVAVFSGVYNVANHYQAIEKQVNRLNAQSERERENIRVLQAEWAFLTSPERMEKVARDYFQLDTFDGRQLVALNNVPLRETLDAQSDNIAIARNEPVAPSAVRPAAAAMPAPIAMPPMIATPVSAVRGQ